MADWDRQLKEAGRVLRRGDATTALRLALPLLAQVDAPSQAYEQFVTVAEQAAGRLDEPRLAASLALYRRDFATALDLLSPERFPVEHAHAKKCAGEAAQAAVLFESAERRVLAARA